MRVNPKQNRSSETVDIISEAATQLLNTPKSPDFTTNHIAERAGVSIGTLYRYFPDKGAILRHVVRREMSKSLDKTAMVIADSQARNAESLVLELLEFTEEQFNGRGPVAYQIRSLIDDDAELLREVQSARLVVMRQLHEKIKVLHPEGIREMSDPELAAATEAFFAASRTLAAHSSDRSVDIKTRLNLVLSLLQALPEQ